MNLTFADECFDLCTSTEVMEHVLDDRMAFREIYRVLRPGGLCMFTVPLSTGPTVTRARLRDGKVEHILEPEYHSDRLKGSRKVLCYRNYGVDVIDRLSAAGFVDARIVTPNQMWFGCVRPVIVGKKAAR